MSPLLPWLAILALLALKPNRNWSAWWIWLPLAGLAAGWHCLELGLQSSDTGLPKGLLEVFLAVPIALAFGLAALWLMASHLGCGHRFRTFLGTLAVLVAFIVFSFAATAGWGLVLEPVIGLLDPRHFAATACTGERALPFLVPLALLALVVAAAMALSGLACRGHQRLWRLCLWLFFAATAGWGLVLKPILGLLDPRHFAATAGTEERVLPSFVPLALLALVVAAAMTLSGLACRVRHRPWRLCPWLFLSLAAVWVAASVLLHFLCWIASPGSVDYSLLQIGPLMVVITFGTLLPFLVLSWVNALFRERLKALFQLEPQEPAPVI